MGGGGGYCLKQLDLNPQSFHLEYRCLTMELHHFRCLPQWFMWMCSYLSEVFPPLLWMVLSKHSIYLIDNVESLDCVFQAECACAVFLTKILFVFITFQFLMLSSDAECAKIDEE